MRDVHFAIRQLNPELERLRKQASLGPTQFWWLVLIVSSFCLGFAYTSYIRTSKLDYPGA